MRRIEDSVDAVFGNYQTDESIKLRCGLRVFAYIIENKDYERCYKRILTYRNVTFELDIDLDDYKIEVYDTDYSDPFKKNFVGTYDVGFGYDDEDDDF